MNWKEFQIQARQDLRSCKILRKENDFGNAAYLLQQSLEKYLKAYLFKYEIFADDPKNLGHLPLKTLWNELAKNTERKIRHSNNAQTKLMFSKLLPVINEVVKLFENIKNPKNTILRHALWKESLNLPLNEEEEALLKQTKTNLERLIPSITETSRLISTNTGKINEAFSDPTKRMKIIDEIKKKTGVPPDNIIDILSKISSNTQNIHTIEDIQKLIPRSSLSFLENAIQDLAENESQNKSQLEIKKLLQGAWVFQFIHEIIQTFTHEDIGRYPTEIGKKIARIIYSEHVDELDKLIEKTETICNKIDQKL